MSFVNLPFFPPGSDYTDIVPLDIDGDDAAVVEYVKSHYLPSELREKHLFVSTPDSGNYIRTYYLNKNKERKVMPPALLYYYFAGVDVGKYKSRLMFVYKREPKFKNSIWFDRRMEDRTASELDFSTILDKVVDKNLLNLKQNSENQTIETILRKENTIARSINQMPPIADPRDVSRMKAMCKAVSSGHERPDSNSMIIKSLTSFDLLVDIYHCDYNIARKKFIISNSSASPKQVEMNEQKKTKAEVTKKSSAKESKQSKKQETEQKKEAEKPPSPKRKDIEDLTSGSENQKEEKKKRLKKGDTTEPKKETPIKETTKKSKTDEKESKKAGDKDTDSRIVINPTSILLQRFIDQFYAEKNLGVEAMADPNLLTKYFELDNPESLSHEEKKIMRAVFELCFLETPRTFSLSNKDLHPIPDSLNSPDGATYNGLCSFKYQEDGSLSISKVYYKKTPIFYEKVAEPINFVITKETEVHWDRLHSLYLNIKKSMGSLRSVTANDIYESNEAFSIAYNFFIILFTC
jgi:hypothetical protein